MVGVGNIGLVSQIAGNTPIGVDFALGTDYLDRDDGGTVSLTGIVDGSYGSGFLWVYIPSTITGDNFYFVNIDNGKLAWRYNVSSSTMSVLATSGANISCTSSAIIQDAWIGLAFSVDVTNQAANNQMYTVTTEGVWTDVLSTNSSTDTTPIDYTGDGGTGQCRIMVSGGAAGTVGASELYFNSIATIDWSDSATQQKIYNNGVKTLGTSGSILTGSDPIVFLRRRTNVTEFGTNQGSGGGMDIVGTLSASGSNPND